MKLFKRERSYGSQIPLYTAAELIERELEGSDYDRGAVEAARAQADNCTKAFARLVQVLFDKEILTRADVLRVAALDYLIEDEL